ncbi:hypothetical protein SACS_1180 [Parasaccharibacter apium]|uniref:Uncharacterized protein n=1 Tax=Parasaccharibacter apium TaxID=1510841 RepID=A0A7U7G6C0_9PROT|nr:hypothetical protein SACS_1180 [Parasaccharibacter apium]
MSVAKYNRNGNGKYREFRKMLPEKIEPYYEYQSHRMISV